MKTAVDIKSWTLIARWFEAGLQVGAWQNAEIGHPDLGHTIFSKVGPGCTYETADDFPKRMPDGTAGIDIAWRYWRKGVYSTPEAFAEDFELEARS